jgi:hypothetical protein
MALPSKPLDSRDLASLLTPRQEEQLAMRWGDRPSRFLDALTVVEARQLRHALANEEARLARVQDALKGFRHQVESATGGAAR